MKKTLFTLSAITMALLAQPVFAAPENNQATAQESTTVQIEKEVEDSVTGVQYEVDENGEFARIRSTGEAELQFGDRKDIRIAIQKAQMRAKANIARFLSERVQSEEVMNSLEEVRGKAENGKSSATRETTESYTESIKTSADQILKGVITTKEDINKDQKYVRIEMGVSPRTQNAADVISRGNRTDSTDGSSSNGATPSQTIEAGSGREVRKAKNYDSF